ncbi:hypothetical protein MKW94_007001 [Papaver nudicaule]|uniref:Uncharacterized protein n=1 Tax=Papaver nudicaule TaxID=74823 RepID=A0AA41VK24_PAPNU|nr:hypothetical protein [Papaver nudicaule]
MLQEPLLAGMSVEAAALCSRWCIQAWQAFKTRPIIPRTRRFYEGGFQPVMTRREAALILCVRIKVVEMQHQLIYGNHSLRNFILDVVIEGLISPVSTSILPSFW